MGKVIPLTSSTGNLRILANSPKGFEIIPLLIGPACETASNGTVKEFFAQYWMDRGKSC